jgi:hypothetical protein
MDSSCTVGFSNLQKSKKKEVMHELCLFLYIIFVYHEDDYPSEEGISRTIVKSANFVHFVNDSKLG